MAPIKASMLIPVTVPKIFVLCALIYGYATNETTTHTIMVNIIAEVIGISNDDIKSHEKFTNKCDLKFMLLSDINSITIKAYESYGDRGIFGVGTLRNTYILKNGIVVKAFEKVNPKTHINEIINALKELE